MGRAEVGKFYKPPLFFNNGGPEGFSERRKVEMNDIPNMETFLEENWLKISEDIKEKINWNSSGMDRLFLDSNILKIMGPEIAIIVALFLEAKNYMEEECGNPHYDGYYKNKAERQLKEMDKYYKDSKGNVWITLPLKTIQQRTNFPINTIKKHIRFLKSINLIKVKTEKRLEKNLTWYFMPKSAYAGIVYYCGWKAGDVLPWKR